MNQCGNARGRISRAAGPSDRRIDRQRWIKVWFGKNAVKSTGVIFRFILSLFALYFPSKDNRLYWEILGEF